MVEKLKCKKRLIVLLLVGLVCTYFIPLVFNTNILILIPFTIVLVLYWLWAIKYAINKCKLALHNFNLTNKEIIREDITDMLRRIRHEQNNHYQIVYSLAQLYKQHRMVKHLEKLRDLDRVYSEIIKLTDYSLFIFFLNQYTLSLEREEIFWFDHRSSLEITPHRGEQVAKFLTRICNMLEKSGQDKEQVRKEWILSETNDSFLVGYQLIHGQKPWEFISEQVWKDLRQWAYQLNINFECSVQKDSCRIQLYVFKGVNEYVCR